MILGSVVLHVCELDRATEARLRIKPYNLLLTRPWKKIVKHFLSISLHLHRKGFANKLKCMYVKSLGSKRCSGHRCHFSCGFMTPVYMCVCCMYVCTHGNQRRTSCVFSSPFILPSLPLFPPPFLPLLHLCLFAPKTSAY